MDKAAFDHIVKVAERSLTNAASQLDKTANSRLRALFKLVNPERRPLGLNQSFNINLGSKRIGSVKVGRPASGDLEIADVILDKKFQGMGLGKKLYGELMRLADSGHIYSVPRRSNQASGLWKSIRSRPADYTVTENFDYSKSLPTFRAGLTRPTPRQTPIAREWDDAIDSY